MLQQGNRLDTRVQTCDVSKSLISRWSQGVRSSAKSSLLRPCRLFENEVPLTKVVELENDVRWASWLTGLVGFPLLSRLLRPLVHPKWGLQPGYCLISLGSAPLRAKGPLEISGASTADRHHQQPTHDIQDVLGRPSYLTLSFGQQLYSSAIQAVQVVKERGRGMDIRGIRNGGYELMADGRALQRFSRRPPHQSQLV